ncbi:hypothetical protein VPH35_016566 [Triticum aestivum]|uniref:Uncharacterized protein n=1 Tax=Aegilops tauschii TaxID=37682 RepID=M8C511_AEGTA
MDDESVENGSEISDAIADGSTVVALPAKPVQAGGQSRANPHWWAGRKFMQEVWHAGSQNSDRIPAMFSSSARQGWTRWRLSTMVGCASRRPPLSMTFGPPSRRSTPGELPSKTTVSFERVPEEAWEPEAVNTLLNKLGDKLINMRPPEDKCKIVMVAWFRNPSKVPKVLCLVHVL